jgi:hypothetical protein
MIAKNKAGFERLLQIGADPNHMIGKQLPLIHIAAKLDDVDWLRLFATTEWRLPCQGYGGI